MSEPHGMSREKWQSLMDAMDREDARQELAEYWDCLDERTAASIPVPAGTKGET